MSVFFKKYFWFIVVIVYLIWPWDLHPTLLDDIVVFGIYLFYILRQAKNISSAKSAYQQSGAKQSQRKEKADFDEQDFEKPLTLQSAYKLLRVSPTATRDELRKAYHARMTSNHPDKVAHLSDELQQRAQELSQRLNRAYDMIQRHKNYKS